VEYPFKPQLQIKGLIALMYTVKEESAKVGLKL